MHYEPGRSQDSRRLLARKAKFSGSSPVEYRREIHSAGQIQLTKIENILQLPLCILNQEGLRLKIQDEEDGYWQEQQSFRGLAQFNVGEKYTGLDK